MKRLWFLGVICLSACGAAPQDTQTNNGEYSRTIVRLAADGNHQVSKETITAEEHQRELDAHAAMMKGQGKGRSTAISVDSGCGGSSMWIFDNTTVHVGSFPLDHEICFFRNGFSGCADLRNYIRQCLVYGNNYDCNYWSTNTSNWIGAYWAGTDSGYFTGTDGSYYDIQSWTYDWAQDNAQSQYWVQHAQYLCFVP